MPRYIPPLGKNTFLELEDTPSSYSGQAKNFVRVKSTEDGLEFTKCDIENYLFDNIIYFNTFFESVDGTNKFLSGTGEITIDGYNLLLSTGGTVNSVARCEKQPQDVTNFTWDKKRRWRVSLYITYTTYQEICCFTGEPTGSYNGIGFIVINNTVYGRVNRMGTITEINLGTITSGFHVFEYILIPGVKVEFYIDGVYKGQITTYLPTGSIQANHIFLFYVRNTAGYIRTLRVSRLEFYQEK